MVSFMIRALHSQAKGPRNSLNRKLGGPQSLSGPFGGKKEASHCWESSHNSTVVTKICLVTATSCAEISFENVHCVTNCLEQNPAAYSMPVTVAVKVKVKSPVTGPVWPRGFQEV